MDGIMSAAASEETYDYPHPELNKEITAIGGHYIITKEVRLSYQGKKLLYVAGTAMVDTTCCGFSGCGFATVAGFVRRWKYKTNEHNLAVSEVTPVTSPAARKELQQLIEKKELVTQVNFN